MKKLLGLILICLVFGGGYFFGTGNSAKIPSERDLRDLGMTASVRTALSLNKHLDEAHIEVQVSDGQVELGGTVPSEGHRLLAGEIASGVAGSDRVVNLLTLAAGPPRAADAEPDRSLGERLDDLTATARIKTALALHRDIRRGDVSVAVMRGVATLSGTVPSWAARELAGKVVEDIEGVKAVRNDLRVRGGSPADSSAGDAGVPPASGPDAPRTPTAVEVDDRMKDGSIRLQVEAALNVNPFIEARRVHTEVLNGHVTLRGSVQTDADRALIQKIVEDCWGVTGVTNELAVEPDPVPLRYTPPAGAARRRPAPYG